MIESECFLGIMQQWEVKCTKTAREAEIIRFRSLKSIKHPEVNKKYNEVRQEAKEDKSAPKLFCFCKDQARFLAF